MFDDDKYIDISIFLLRLSQGRTFPNPTVASIIVETEPNKDLHAIIGFGITSKGGRPHAESNALDQIKIKKNFKYTLYSTLEPCSHIGRDTSCAKKIIDSGIKRVVFCLLDPDKRVRGKGRDMLQKNGVEVIYNVRVNEAYNLYKGYFLNKLKSRPKVVLKVATSIDGKIAEKPRTSTKITSSSTNKFMHILRSKFDGILVGSETVKIDNCKLDCRVQGLEEFSPVRIVLNKKLDLNPSYKIFKDCHKIKTILITESSDTKKINQFKKKNVEVVCIPKSKYKISFILRILAKKNISNLLVEGGSKIFSSFLASKYFDEIIVLRGNFFIGSSGIDILSSSRDDFLKKKFNLYQLSNLEDDVFEIYEAKSKKLTLE